MTQRTSHSTTESSKSAAVVLADQRVARVLIARPTQGKALDLTEADSISNDHEGVHQRTRPDMLSGPGKRGAEAGSGVVGGPHTVNNSEDTQAEEDRRFAREVASWLADRPERTDGDRLQVFASRRFLGMLRDQLDPNKASHVELSDGEYAQMPDSELRTHAALRRALPLG
ncbi:MAG: host attachment protein [Phycisphaerales bacterium]|jgi:protein required for attachment to host cells